MNLCNKPSLRITALAALCCAMLLGSASAAAQEDCEDTPEGRICKDRQRITGGTVVDATLQRQLGLVSVRGACSATLLNRYWVLTARHCVTTTGMPGGPLLTPAQVTITADWAPNQIGIASRILDFATNVTAPGSADIVLFYLGTADLGNVNSQRIYAIAQPMGGTSMVLSGRLQTTDTVTQYGRGFSTFATGVVGGSPAAVPAAGLGTWRSARFTPSQVTGTAYTLVMNGTSQVGHGGDSGGPSIVTVNNQGVGIAGVQSTCTSTGYVPNAPVPPGATNPGWMWSTGIDSCGYVSTEPFWTEIRNAIRETPGCRGGAACALPAILSANPPMP